MKSFPPVLTPDQLKRFRHFLVDRRFYPSLTKAAKATDSAVKCHAVFLQVIDSMDDLSVLGDDILDAYVVDEPVTEPVADQTHKKRKGRGKQKTSSMVRYPFRLPEDMLEQLKGLEGTVSEHIRRAIRIYLQAVKPD